MTNPKSGDFIEKDLKILIILRNHFFFHLVEYPHIELATTLPDTTTIQVD